MDSRITPFKHKLLTSISIWRLVVFLVADSIEEIRQSWSHLFCIMGISKLVKRLVHVEMALLFVNSGQKLGTASATPSPRYKQASPEGAPGRLPSLSQKPLRLTQSKGKPADPGREARCPAWWRAASAAPSPGYKQTSPEGAPGRLPNLSQKPLRLTQSMGKPADSGRGAREARGLAWLQITSAAPSPGYKQTSPEGAPGWFSSLESETSETD